MAEEKSAKPAKAAPTKSAGKERDPDAPDLKESDAEAPGPITAEHESGSWEQTIAEREAREKAREASSAKSK